MELNTVVWIFVYISCFLGGFLIGRVYEQLKQDQKNAEYIKLYDEIGKSWDDW